jgi:hypothetical protein
MLKNAVSAAAPISSGEKLPAETDLGWSIGKVL